MGAGTKVGGLALGVVVTVGVVSWFGNATPDSEHGPKYKKNSGKTTPTATVAPSPTKRVVLIRVDHREGKTDKHILWDFGNGNKGGETVPYTVKSYEISDTVDVGAHIYAAAQTREGKYKLPEALRVQIFVDNVPKCPDDFFGRGKTVECHVTVE